MVQENTTAIGETDILKMFAVVFLHLHFNWKIIEVYAFMEQLNMTTESQVLTVW